MEMSEVAERAREQLAKMTKLPPSGVTAVTKADRGWVVTIEMLEKKSIPDGADVLGIYEVKLSEQGQVDDFQRVRLRRRSDTAEE
jgi:hypothetical protein